MAYFKNPPICAGLSLLLRQVFPIPPRHVLKLLPWIQSLADAYRLEVGAPQILQELVVVAQHIVVQPAVGKVERHR